MVNLITEHIDIWTAAQTQKTNSGRGRGQKSNGQTPHGIKKLRELILELAVRGKLVPQDPNDEPASVLLEKIAEEKAQLIKEGKIKKQKKLPEISDDQKPFELPKNWEWVRLGEIGVWAIGSGFPKKEQGYEGLEILFSKVSDMNLKGNEKYIYTTRNTISEKTASKLKINVHHEGTVIFPKIGGAIATNKRRIIVKPTAIDNNCLGITPTTGFDTEYLYLYLSSLDLTEYQVGTSVPALSQGTLELISLGLPPLAEQHRIDAKVDELMALCAQLEQQETASNATHQTLVETLLATLTTAADQDELTEVWQRIAGHFDTLFTTEHSIDQFKKAILQLAVMGKLVPQDPNDEPANVLLEKIAKEKARLIKEGKIKKQKSLPKITEEEKLFKSPLGWEWVRLGDLSILKGGFAYKSSVFSGSGKHQVIRMGNIRPDYLRFDEKPAYITADLAEETSEYQIELNNILLTMTGTKGKRDYLYSLIVRPEHLEARKLYLNQRLCIIRGLLLVPEFLNMALKDDRLLDAIYAQSTGTANQANIGMVALNNWVLPMPPIAEQHRIVAKVDELMALCETLKARLNDAQTTQVQLADTIVEQAVA